MESKDNKDFRDLIDEKFSNIQRQLDLQFGAMHKTLGSIEEQTKKTNGRISDAEKKLQALELSEATHSIRCPKAKDFEHMEKSIADLKNDVDTKLQDISFFVRNPKLALAIIVVAVIVSLFSYFEVRNYISIQAEKTNIEIPK